MTKSNRLTLYIIIAMALGIVVGAILHHSGMDEARLISISSKISIITTVFLNLIKMIIAPLVLSTLVVGVAKLGDVGAVGRIGGKTMLWFISASLVSLLLGMVLVNLFQPGLAMNLPLPEAGADTGLKTAEMTLENFITHIFPKSVFKALADNEILQIVVFALFFGVAAAGIGEKADPVVKAMDSVGHIMLKLTGYVMNFAPLAVFSAICVVIATKGFGVLGTYAIFMAEFFLGLVLLWCLLIGAGFLLVGPRIFTLVRRIKEPFLIAFSTSSSEAAFPKLTEELERFGCNKRIVSFVLPLGYSFNLDGSMLYMTFASIFIAQCYGIDLSLGQEITMLLTLMVTSKGVAGVPRASLVVIAGTLAMFGIPEEGIILLLGIDTFLDMGRSATNVIGNAVATVAVSKWEGELKS
jgi:Na+/H+-dicarboxylate symporter